MHVVSSYDRAWNWKTSRRACVRALVLVWGRCLVVVSAKHSARAVRTWEEQARAAMCACVGWRLGAVGDHVPSVCDGWRAASHQATNQAAVPLRRGWGIPDLHVAIDLQPEAGRPARLIDSIGAAVAREPSLLAARPPPARAGTYARRRADSGGFVPVPTPTHALLRLSASACLQQLQVAAGSAT